MGIEKQAFYEGAALHMLSSRPVNTAIRYEQPFFILDDRLLAYLKYCTRPRSPWGFTFTPDEQALLSSKGRTSQIVIGLICGSDGVAAVTYADYKKVAHPKGAAIHLACYRGHGHHYQIAGPDGKLEYRIAPSSWRGLLDL